MTKTRSEDQTTETQMIKISKRAMRKESVKSETINGNKRKEDIIKNNLIRNGDHKNDGKDNDGYDSSKSNNVSKKKNKLKKNKKCETDKHNISMKTSFSKFDALQKLNLIQVRSLDSSAAHELSQNRQGEIKIGCRLCDKPVYKMEEIKAEKSIFHKNCFRCHECKKHLKVDTYQSHEGILYCIVHYKLLFAPKCVENYESVQPRKPELIIRENEPMELPPNIVRASNKPDLGLEELQQINVRLRFQIFEQGKTSTSKDRQDIHHTNISNNMVRRSAYILSKVAKLQQLDYSGAREIGSVSSSNNQKGYDDADENISSTSDNPNTDLISQTKRERNCERPVGIGEAMDDIRTLFEKGDFTAKEERREERKQEIQNIRSRLFMGKQARIKEIYQQAVAESEHEITAACENPSIDIEVDSKSLRERFEKGEIFTHNHSADENDGGNHKKGEANKEADIFECAIGKKSRSIFMELDANVVNNKTQNSLPSQATSRILQNQKLVGSLGKQSKSGELDNDVVKYDEAVEDVKITTSEISEKFKFFETYHLIENKQRIFRVTPPREGVLKMPSPDDNSNKEEKAKEVSPNRSILELSGTTSMLLNKFRELEKNCNKNADNYSLKPLKCFTPPPDGNQQFYVEQDSDEYDSNKDYNDDEEDEDEMNNEDDDSNIFSQLPKDGEAFKEIQRTAKQLRLKFEKWQTSEIKREKNNDLYQNIYVNTVSDKNSIKTTQLIRERFEKMRNPEKHSQPMRPHYQVNRFV